MRNALSSSLLTLALIATIATLAPTTAFAGCGCDHPPPSWSVVMPPFGSPGREVTVYADGFSFTPGNAYRVRFDGAEVVVIAESDDRVVATLPKGLEPGPTEVRVQGQDDGVDVTYPDSVFTALAPARFVEDRSGVFYARSYQAAIAADGTLYVSVDVTEVLDPMQFTFALHGLALHFEADDVVIYNADGVDLTLFTLEVDDPTKRQWGSYYGWTVESDARLPNTFYLPKAVSNLLASQFSSLFTYWRHEFYTYAKAHQPGGSHEVDANGLHPDGTLHVDHDHLVIAIHGVERDASDPHDLGKARPLAPGKRTVNVGWVSLQTDGPVELNHFASLISASTDPSIEDLDEKDDDD